MKVSKMKISKTIYKLIFISLPLLFLAALYTTSDSPNETVVDILSIIVVVTALLELIAVSILPCPYGRANNSRNEQKSRDENAETDFRDPLN